MTLSITYERLTVPQIFGKAFAVFKHRFRVFLTLSTIVAVPMIVFGAAVSSYAFSHLTDIMDSFDKLQEDQAAIMDIANGSDSKPAYTPEEMNGLMEEDMRNIIAAMVNHAGFFIGILVIQTLLFSVLTICGRGAMIRATAELYVSTDADPQWLQCFQQGLSRFWSLFCAGVLMSFGFILLYGFPMLLFYGGYLALAILTFMIFPLVLFYCSVRLTLVFPAIVVENLSAVDGLKRSWDLSRNAFCDIFCALFGAIIVIGIATNIVVKILVGNDPLAIYRPLGLVVSQSLGIFVMPYMAILMTILYFNLRITKEGMNQQTLSRELVAKGYQGVALLDEDEEAGLKKNPGTAAISEGDFL